MLVSVEDEIARLDSFFSAPVRMFLQFFILRGNFILVVEIQLWVLSNTYSILKTNIDLDRG